MHYVRIWADGDGESHLDDVALPVTVTPAEPGVAELLVGHAGAVDRLDFVTLDSATQDDGWHTAPRRQFVVFLTGHVTIETSDGDRRELPIGGTVLAEDLHGHGHVTSYRERKQQRVLVIPLDASADA